jgi:hypothetical protein
MFGSLPVGGGSFPVERGPLLELVRVRRLGGC